MGFENFTSEINVSCENHGGPGLGAIQQWDANSGTWSLITDFVGSDRAVVDALIEEDSSAYAAENNIADQCS
jgi:branched-chain amino acid transport system substrate-binding protein